MRVFLFFCIFFLSNSPKLDSKELEESGFIPVKKTPILQRTEDFKTLELAFQESKSYFERLPADWKIKFHKNSYNKKEFLNSLKRLKTLLKERDVKKRKIEFQKSFLLLETADPNEGKITGYYEVIIEAKYRPDAEFSEPILETPSDLIVKKQGSEKIVGKILNGNFIPYDSRIELEDPSSWKNRTKSIGYVKIVDLHLAQLEGSAIVRIPGQNPFRITYSSDNGKRYISPSESLNGVCPSLIPSDLRNCIVDHPQEVRTAILKNPRYVFFQKETSAPRGSGGIELIPKRSVAMDPNIPLGIPALISFESPAVTEENRLVFVHDRGSKITGHGRLDYFLGTGKKAEEQAGRIQTPGRIFLILPKK
ncbi:MltA domain-containing protein [Leptospira adleri]|uniref:peptidoglycan lytic exotransglycosylase n=1 Tax=Leptospira adleri TaxID=2023186 RepID=A0A2M9YK42_9LEPT|nr:MltA domain-containing protein [Leptospira adleri]PJZ51899.1 murein transglycosylase [Leptospira adleri]PJZ61623.1 murein transglycosylase [Leptospira adleri]